MPWRLLADVGRRRFVKHLAFALHVDFDVCVRRIEMRVPEPVTNHIDVVASTQKMHRGGMPDPVGIERSALYGRPLCLCLDAVLTGHMADAEARDR